MSNSSITSSYSPEDVAGIAALQTYNYIYVALMAVVLYESFITIGMEVEYIWCWKGGKKSYVGALLFLGNRYISILYGVVGFFADLIPLTSCNALTRFIEAILLALMLLFAFFSAYRVYGAKLWKYKLLAPLVFLLDMIPFSLNLYAYIMYRPMAVGPAFAPCEVFDPISPIIEARFVRASRLSSAMADAIVLILICVGCMRSWRHVSKTKGMFGTSEKIREDGAVYFFILLAMNIAQIVTFELLMAEYLTSFIYILTPVMSCRLLLNLRESDKHRTTTDVHLYTNMDMQLQAFLESDAEKLLGQTESTRMSEVPSTVNLGLTVKEIDSDSSSGSRESGSSLHEKLSIHEISIV